jgi:hypothetical protein|nr:MAG TPA: Protein of unknown function (DUF1642) [Caudoviricetes sp.]
MNEKKLIEKIGNLDKLYGEKFYVALDDVLDLVKQLDEPETGHADEAPRYVKNILARLRELPLHDREVWLKAIMSEFEQDFSHAKWREGHEVEKEKKYKVVLLNYNDGHLNLVNVRTLGENIIFFTKKTQFDPRSLKLTKAEIISSGFGWVFDCPGIKIEEVKNE